MDALKLENIDFSRQLESTLYKSDGEQIELATDGAMIRIKDCGTNDVAKIELVVAERFPVAEYPERFEPVAKAIRNFGYSFEDFDRSRSFYELTVER